MAVKFSCPKCGRRFTEWGAERLGFKCPKDEHCPKDASDDIELVRVGVPDDRVLRRPALKKGLRRTTPYVAPSALSEDEVVVPDIEEIEAATEIEGEIGIEGEEFVEVDAEEEETFEPGVADEIVDETEAHVEGEVEGVVEIPLEADEAIEEADENATEEWND